MVHRDQKSTNLPYTTITAKGLRIFQILWNETATSCKFEKDGAMLSVVTYFRDTYNVRSSQCHENGTKHADLTQIPELSLDRNEWK